MAHQTVGRGTGVQLGRGAAALALALLVGACGSSVASPSGPYASPKPSGAQAVIARGCADSREGPEATDVAFVQDALPRQQADLQRVSDDISGAVPGGNLQTDTGLAATNAHELVDLVSRSTLCSPFREDLLKAAKDLSAADDALSSSGGDAGALATAQAAFAALKAIADNPPRPGASPTP